MAHVVAVRHDLVQRERRIDRRGPLGDREYGGGIHDDPRHVIWADCQIVAIAVTRQCEAIYTHDPGLTTLHAPLVHLAHLA